MFRRQTTGSVVCASCGYLVGVNDDKCYHCGRRNPGLWGFASAVRRLGNDMGFVPFVTGFCIVIYVLTLLMSGGNFGGLGMMSFLAPSSQATLIFGASGAFPVFDLHRWWTVLSASWLHANLIHILFNVLWIRQLAPPVAEMYGPGRMVIVYTVAGVVGFAATSTIAYVFRSVPLPGFLHGAEITVGASASIFGLLGALVYYGRRTGSSLVHGQAMSWALTMFVFGLIMPGVDNYAHAGGFVGGFLAGRLMDPLKPERINHIVGALVCLGLSLLSIIASVLHAMWISRG
jgi:membrane associated rhomboid family serine protease